MAGSRYAPDYSSLVPASNAPSAMSADDVQRKKQGDFLRFLGSVAPTVGTIGGLGIGAMVGGPAGAAVGAGIGGGVGELAGSGLNYAGDQQTAQREQAETGKAQRRQEMMNALMAMRH